MTKPVRAAPRVETIRRRALDAARTLLDEGGEEKIQLRALAAKIGCGVASLYYHFADKDELLAALATEGFQEMDAAIARAMDKGRFPRKIDAASAGYLTFMRKNLRLYALMHSDHTLMANEEVRAAERAAFTTFQSSMLDDERVPAERVAEVSLLCWALGRGIASIVLSQGDINEAAARRLAERVLAGFSFLLDKRFSG
jgi:AcrR family transcriptional regulator